MLSEALRRIQKLVDESEATIPFWLAADQKDMVRDYAGSVFLSHTSPDLRYAIQFIIPPVAKAVENRFFIHNKDIWASLSSAAMHAMLVRSAIETCKTMLLVASRASAASDWVQWECHAASLQKHPIIVCLIDTVDLNAFGLDAYNDEDRRSIFEIVDFRANLGDAQSRLSALLELPQFAVGDWNGRPLGTPGTSRSSFNCSEHLAQYKADPTSMRMRPDNWKSPSPNR